MLIRHRGGMRWSGASYLSRIALAVGGFVGLPVRCAVTAVHWSGTGLRRAVSGTIASWTVGHRPGAESAPSVVVMVRLDEQDDLLVPGYIDGPADGRGLRIGQSVDVGFDDVEFGSQGWRVAVLRWRLR